MKKKLNGIFCLFFTLLCCISLMSGCGSSGKSGYKIAVVPKLTKIGWFQRMEKGVKAYNTEHGTDYFYGGSVEGADQAAYIEQLLAEDWDAICVVPFDSASIAPLLEKAKKDGIVVITHEAASMEPSYFHYDIEAFQAQSFGENFAKQLIEKTGGEGTYIQLVGSLNSVSHQEWCDAADAYFAANSNLKKLGRYETNDDLTTSYNVTKELLQSHPEINAIEGSASTDIAGAARAVEELGLAGKVQIVGASLSSVCGEYVKNGTIASFSLWDSAEAGKAMIALAEAVLESGEDFSPESCSLPIGGYETMSYKNGVFYGDTRIDVTAENIEEYNY